jgi:hypothetical protein
MYKSGRTGESLPVIHAMRDISRALEWIAVVVLIGAFVLAVLAVAGSSARSA